MMKRLFICIVIAVALLFSNVTMTQSVAVASYSVVVDPPPGHTDNGKHKGHEKKAEANGYKRHQKDGSASTRRNNNPPPSLSSPSVSMRQVGIPDFPKIEKKPKKPKSTKKNTGKETIKYVYVKVPVPSKPEVIVKTDTVVDKVIYGAGIFFLALTAVGLLGLFSGFLHGWRRRGKYEIEQMKSLLGK